MPGWLPLAGLPAVKRVDCGPMEPFLRDYRIADRHGPRIERILGAGRAFLTVGALVAIYLDPTEPTRFATVMYGLLLAYAVYSLAVLVAIRRADAVTPHVRRLLHGGDVLWAAAITFFSAGPISPFFLFFLFVVMAAAYRGGFRETIATTLLVIAIVLIQTAVAVLGPWGNEFANGVSPDDLSRLVMRTTYLLLTGFLLAYLAEQEKQSGAEILATAAVMSQPRVSSGLGGSIAAVARLTLRLFEARAVEIVMQEEENRRTLSWRAEVSPGETAGVAVRRGEMDVESQPEWLAPHPCRTWIAEKVAGAQRANAWGVQPDKWPVQPMLIENVPSWWKEHNFTSVAAADCGLAGEWRARVYLFDAKALERSRERLHFLESLVDHVTPALSNVFFLRRLRARASSAERARVARELHDGAIQALLGIEMETEALRRRALHENSPFAPDLLRIDDLLREEVSSLRELMQELRPIDIDAPQHLPDVLASLVERFRRDTGIAARFASNVTATTLSMKAAVEVVRIVQEGLVNVRKHSKARNVSVRFEEEHGGWAVRIEDDGCGYEFDGRLTGAELDARWLGPSIIKERARLLNGEVVVESSRGRGASVEVRFKAPAMV